MPIAPRRVTRAEEMRALGHPVRLRLVDLLASEGPLTASDAARRLDETPSNVSWHLRQLAVAGFVRQGKPVGRRRPWKVVAEALEFGPDAEDPAAAQVLSDVLIEHEVQILRSVLASVAHESQPWQDAATVASSRHWLTAAEAAALGHRLRELVQDTELQARVADPSRRPTGARLTSVIGWVAPYGPVAELAASEDAPLSSAPADEPPAARTAP